jgi:hypothetical protein
MFNSSTEKSDKITSHTLHSMPGTRDFYDKNGFVIMTEHPLSPNKQQPMSRHIYGGNQKRKTRRKSRRLVIKKIIQ